MKKFRSMNRIRQLILRDNFINRSLPYKIVSLVVTQCCHPCLKAVDLKNFHGAVNTRQGKIHLKYLFENERSFERYKYADWHTAIKFFFLLE